VIVIFGKHAISRRAREHRAKRLDQMRRKGRHKSKISRRTDERAGAVDGSRGPSRRQRRRQRRRRRRRIDLMQTHKLLHWRHATAKALRDESLSRSRTRAWSSIGARLVGLCYRYGPRSSGRAVPASAADRGYTLLVLSIQLTLSH